MKRFVYCFLAGLLCLACRQAARQPAWVITEPTSAVTNAPGREYPKINPDLSVTFRATDADVAGATDVVLDICGKRYPMVHADGYWEATSDPLVPGFHYYFLRLDGRQTADPASRHFYGCGMMSSGIEIPEEGMEYHLEQDVPHGRISKMTYHSNYTDSERVLYVYTPAGYDEASDTRYPVVYIQHGGGEDETGWPTQGHMNYILDNLIAAGKAVPMIIVSANSNLPATPGQPRGAGLAAWAPFRTELLESIVPFIDATFRTQADAAHRAMCGLSMGGQQSFFIGLNAPETFRWIGMFSAGCFGNNPNAAPTDFDFEASIPGIFSNTAAFNAAHDLFFISCGEQDPRITHTAHAAETLRAHGVAVEYRSYPGDHEWETWRKSLRDFAQLLFR